MPEFHTTREASPLGTAAGPAQDAPADALRREISAARLLLDRQLALESAIRGGCSGPDLEPLVRAQEAAARDAARASLERRRHLEGADAVERWLATLQAGESARMQELVADGRRIRTEIQRSARRCEFLARRAVEWTQAQIESLVHAATGPGATYGATGGRATRRPSSWMEKSA